jgi:hypothetical protein
MGLESTTYTSGLVATNPTSSDAKSQGDDHLRLIKSAILATWPNITGAVTLTHTQINALRAPSGDHIVTVTTGNGHGSTNTKIRRWTTTQESTGTAVTYADSATNGGAFTIVTAGLYEIHYSEDKSSGGAYFGISVNSNQLTTSVYSITATHRKAMAYQSVAGGNLTVTRVLKLAASDVVRAHTDGTPNDTDIADSVFSIRLIGVTA